jgi:hypothetical protein
VDGIGIGEDVVGRLPIGVFVGSPEVCQSECRRVREGSAKVGSSSAFPDRRLKAIHDGHRVIAHERHSQCGVI